MAADALVPNIISIDECPTDSIFCGGGSSWIHFHKPVANWGVGVAV